MGLSRRVRDALEHRARRRALRKDGASLLKSRPHSRSTLHKFLRPLPPRRTRAPLELLLHPVWSVRRHSVHNLPEIQQALRPQFEVTSKHLERMARVRNGPALAVRAAPLLCPRRKDDRVLVHTHGKGQLPHPFLPSSCLNNSDNHISSGSRRNNTTRHPNPRKSLLPHREAANAFFE